MKRLETAVLLGAQILFHPDFSAEESASGQQLTLVMGEVE